MPIKSPDEVYRDYETDGVPSSGAHRPIKQDIRDLLNALAGGFLSTPRIITAAGAYTVGDLDALFIVNLPAPGTVAFTFGPVANRGKLQCEFVDHAASAAAILTFTPNGAENVGGRTGSPAWTASSAGIGMGVSIAFKPDTTLNGWIVK